MSKFKPDDRVAKHGTVQESRIAVNTHTLVKFDNDMEVYVPTDTLKPLKKRGKLVAKWETKIETHETGWPKLKLTREELSIHTDFVGKRVEVTVRLIEENKK